jgi:hypothetical protein
VARSRKGTLASLRMRVFLVGAICLGLLLNLTTPSKAQAPRNSLAQEYGVVLRSFNATLTPIVATDMAQHVLLLASYYSLDPRLLVAIVGVESGWHVHAVSSSGAQGLGQLMPSTADGLSVQALEKYENLDGTARYIRRLLNTYATLPTERRYSLALAGYNAGPDAVRRYGGVPPYAETQAYVQQVLGLWHRLRAKLPVYTPAITAAHVAAPVTVAKHVAATSTVELAPIDAQAIGLRETRSLEGDAVLPKPKKTIGRWLARALGVH